MAPCAEIHDEKFPCCIKKPAGAKRQKPKSLCIREFAVAGRFLCDEAAAGPRRGPLRGGAG